MAILARRLTIFLLGMTVFTLTLASLVEISSRNGRQLRDPELSIHFFQPRNGLFN